MVTGNMTKKKLKVGCLHYTILADIFHLHFKTFWISIVFDVLSTKAAGE